MPKGWRCVVIESAVAQALTPVAGAPSGFSAVTAALVGLIVLAAAAWYFLIHKRGKDAEAKAVATELAGKAKAEGVVLAGVKGEIVDWVAQLNKALDTIHAQSKVLVLPPVQAAINAPAVIPASAPATPSTTKLDEITAAVMTASRHSNPASSIVSLLQGGATVHSVAAVVVGQKGFDGYTADDVEAIRAAMQNAGLLS